MRLQIDMAVQKFGNADVTALNENKGVVRLYGQSWMIFRL
jgi:hypothetical protein